MFKVLVIDDDASNAEVIKMLLEEENYDALSLTKSNLILPTITDFKPDLIVMDILLDDGDGREICDSIKLNPNTSYIPIILITALLETEALAIPSKADAILFKPFDCTQLYKKAASLLNKF